MSKLNKKSINGSVLLRVILLVIWDMLMVNVVAVAALYLRCELADTDMFAEGFADTLFQLTVPNTLLCVGVFAIMRLYSSLWGFAGGDELLRIAVASCIVMAIQLVVLQIAGIRLPRLLPVLFGMLLFICMICTRFSYRFIRRARLWFAKEGRQRTMLIGAGQAGALVLREFRNSSFSKNKVVCIIDDDPMKLGRQLMGVRVVGGREYIEEAVERYGVTEIILAIPTLPAQIKKEVWDICSRTGCKFKQMPGIYQLANGEVSIQAIRDIDIEDLLERDIVKVDMGGLADLIRDNTVMVTGGGGSIGSELCRQLASYQPKELVIFDIYENNAYAIELELKANYPELTIHVLIGSVRDRERIESVMQTYRPTVVYHAAAHKHVPLMERSPLEAVKNNVFGTYNTARAADLAGVEHFVLISTDKAVNPTNVMGASKRICEMIIQSFAETSKTCFAAVRFGNVLGSNGSVIPLFREQIRKGGPVTVTHPEITRFFMTIPEAVSLVLQAGAFAKGGEIFVLDMGEPVRIDDLARNMIRLSGFQPDVDIPIVYSGLRPGEKLYEELLMGEEGLTKTANDLIYVGHKIDFDSQRFLDELEALGSLTEGQEAQLRRQIRTLVPTYAPPAEVANAL
ncbi:MAG: polysaccharide biosynthesis protein [Oscillospiraceae bacterium]|nr:polysaccharide biosynthesis protein [Oscillospiraceae bacterium]